MGTVTVLIICISILSLAGFILISFAAVALYRFLKDLNDETAPPRVIGYPSDNLKKAKNKNN